MHIKFVLVLICLWIAASGCKVRVGQQDASSVQFVKMNQSDMFLSLDNACLDPVAKPISPVFESKSQNANTIEALSKASKSWYRSYTPPKEFYDKFASIQSEKQYASYIISVADCKMSFHRPPFKDGEVVSKAQLSRAKNDACEIWMKIRVSEISSGTIVDEVEVEKSNQSLGRLVSQDFTGDKVYSINNYKDDCRSHEKLMTELAHEAVTLAMKRIHVK